MALEPDVPIASIRTEYTCPMHPEIVRPAPVRVPSAAWRWSRAPSPPPMKQSRTARHDPAFLDQRRAHSAAHADRHVPNDARSERAGKLHSQDGSPGSSWPWPHQ